MTLYVWPWRLLVPRAVRLVVEGSTLLGPPALDTTRQASSTTAGGLWRAILADITLRTPDQVRCADAWAAHLDQGVTECIVPLPKLWTAPRPIAGGRPMRPGEPAPTDDYFAQEAELGSPMMIATAGAADLRATELVITVTQGSAIRGGERFSIDHGEAAGWRVYRIGRVVSAGGGVHTVKVRPPLRAAIDAGDAVEFDVPRCVMRSDPASAAEIEAMIEHGRRGTISVEFVESF